MLREMGASNHRHLEVYSSVDHVDCANAGAIQRNHAHIHESMLKETQVLRVLVLLIRSRTHYPETNVEVRSVVLELYTRNVHPCAHMSPQVPNIVGRYYVNVDVFWSQNL